MRYVPSSTVRSMVVYGASGLAFLGANLLLARALSTDHYALVTLVVALVTLGYHLAPIGLDGVAVRGRVDLGPPLLKRLFVASTAVGAGMAAVAFIFYGISTATAALLLPACVAGALKLVAAARFQGAQRFGLALSLQACPNVLLLLGAAATLALGRETAYVTLLVLTLGLVAAAAIAWTLVLRERASTKPSRPLPVPWREAAALAGVSAAGMVFIQLERLVIPHVLPAADLALFGVLAAIAGSLFRLLQMGVGFSLLPRLRNAATVFERRRLIAHEARFAVVIAVAGSAAILVAAPLVERWFLAGKYALPTALVVAAIFSGVAKIAHAFARVAATALGTPRELSRVNGAGWASVALAVGAAVLAAPWGLTGVVYGVGLGWLAWAIMMFAVVYRHLRAPAGVPAET